MSNEKNPENIREDGWLEETVNPAELGTDEAAVAAAGLTTPEDDALDKLLAEIKAENWIAEESATEESVPEAPQPEQAVTDATVVLPQVDFPESMPLDAAEPFRDEDFRQAFGEGKELEEMFTPGDVQPEDTQEEMPAVEAPAETPKAPKGRKKKTVPQKRRPKHKKGYGFFGIPHILATCVWLGLAVIIGASLGRVLWMLGADVLAFNQEPKTVTITITEEDTLDTIAQQLYEAELIRYPELFKLFAEFTGKAEDISPGSFTLNEPNEDGEIPGIAYDYNALLNSMKKYSPAREIVEDLLIPEGYSCAQIFAKLEEYGVCTVAELEEYAANGELSDYWFLEGVERGDKYCLEGYLYPATYDFYVDDDPGRVLEKFLDAFDYYFTDRMKESLATINDRYAQMMRSNGYSEEYIAEHTMDIREVVIIASMVEKESPGADESYTISSVIYNRLSDPDFSLLQIDATVVYAHGGNAENMDYKIDSPYNTYLYGGLPVGPISNPGMSSLDAALNPLETEYYYYALYEDSSEHGFFTNLDDFEDFLWENGYYDEE